MIRPAVVEDATAIANIHVQSWRSTYRGLMPSAVLDSLSVEQRSDFWRQVMERARRQFLFVATDEEGSIIGFANGGPEREKDTLYTAELYALYFLQECQGHGYGKALMRATVERFVEQGHSTMLLWVLSTNPSRGFYEAMGGRYLKTKPIEIGGETLEEAAYGWADLSAFLTKYASANA